MTANPNLNLRAHNEYTTLFFFSDYLKTRRTCVNTDVSCFVANFSLAATEITHLEFLNSRQCLCELSLCLCVSIGQQPSSSTPVCHWRMVLQLWFISFISASTVLRQVVFCRSHFRFPSGVQRIATLVMELASLHSTCPIRRQRFLVMTVYISSRWDRVS